jgi:hypothetical protein
MRGFRLHALPVAPGMVLLKWLFDENPLKTST